MSEKKKKIQFKINNKVIDQNSKTFVISEIGINHEGSLSECIKMIEESKKAGADAVKLQTVSAANSYLKNTKSYKEFEKTNFSDEKLFKIIKFAKARKLIFLSTPGSFEEVDRLVKLGVSGIKISSGSMTNFPLISYAAKKTKSIIISTGMAYQSEIKNAVSACNSNKNLAILKCTSLYPPEDDELNLRSIKLFKKFFKHIIGYSDHKKDYLSCINAVCNGAKIIEKHFTLDSSKKGKDHHISLEPKKFKRMVEDIRRTEIMQGKNQILPTDREIKNRNLYHRCLVTKQEILKGEKFTLENISFKRVSKKSSYGLEPKYYEKILFKKSLKRISKDVSLKKNMVNLKN